MNEPNVTVVKRMKEAIMAQDFLSAFDEDELNAIAHATFYSNFFTGRINGHNHFMLVAKLVDQLREFAEENARLEDLIYQTVNSED